MQKKYAFLVFCGIAAISLGVYAQVNSYLNMPSDTFLSASYRRANIASTYLASTSVKVAKRGISSALSMIKATTTYQAASPTPTKKTWGAYVGWQTADGPNFEAKVGKTMPIRATFVHWGNENEFPAYLSYMKSTSQTMVIFWEAMDYNGPTTDQPRFSYTSILRGDWDSYIKSFKKQAIAYGGPVILIPFEEANGDWYPWSGTQNGNTVAQHIAAFRYLRDMFRDAPNVKFGWSMNADSVPNTSANSITAYYPGANYVDVVGVNGFNFDNPWQSFDEIFGSVLKTLRTFSKPIYIFSMASADGPKKAAWITDALVTQMNKHSEITGWVWFNENKEKNWLVWSDPNSLKAFQAALP